MLTDFFFKLREKKVPVSLTEWLTFIEALDKGLAYSNVMTFYHLARSLLVKDISFYDAFDEVFAHVFKNADLSPGLKKEIEDWLDNPLPFPDLTEEEIARLHTYDYDRLREEFEKRLKEQHERHDGGNRWVGTGGTSPFGHGGINPAGIRVGGEGGMHMAVQVAMQRRFRNYRHDITLDTRQMKVALKKLRALERIGSCDELDLDETVEQTGRNAGDIELIWRPAKKNRMKLLLLMDAGGSMDPYARLVGRLFSAASQISHFKQFNHFYFHNCIYEEIFEDMSLDRRVPTATIFKDFNSEWRVILVGDAAMSPYELTARHGAIYYYHHNDTPGIVWLQRFAEHFRKIIWLNPIPRDHWWSQSIHIVDQVFPMFPLSVQGLEEAVSELL